MVHIRECMRRWLPFVIMAASLGVSPAQDVASPDAADLDLDLVKLKSGPKGRQREAMRKVLLLVHLKQKETWLAESTGDEAVHLAAEISSAGIWLQWIWADARGNSSALSCGMQSS